jgi:hypothetical protein
MEWTPHKQLGHARDVTFESPVRIAFGPKRAACHQTQVHRFIDGGGGGGGAALVVETSQVCLLPQPNRES